MKRTQTEPEAGNPVDTPEDATAGPEAGADSVAVGDVADDIAAQLIKVETEVAELKDAWLRAKAETENVRKQAEVDVAKAHKYAVERFAEDLLPVKDALEQTLAGGEVSLETLRSGAALTLKAAAGVVRPRPGRWKSIRWARSTTRIGIRRCRWSNPTCRRTPSWTSSRRATSSTTACCGPRW